MDFGYDSGRDQMRLFPKARRRGPRVGLALGGGGVRGLAHVGVLRVLTEAGVPVDAIAGVSMGAVVGAAYALSDGYPDTLLALVRDVRFSPIRALPRKGEAGGVWTSVRRLIDVERFLMSNVFSWGVAAAVDPEALATAVTGNRRLEDARVPLAVVACDLKSGQPVVFRTGLAAVALRASAALPGFFRPLEHEGRLLADGGYVGMVPTGAARELGAELVIAVDADPLDVVEGIHDGLHALLRALDITSERYKAVLLDQADVVIQPDFGGAVDTLDFSRVEECVEAGARAAREALPDIQRRLSGRRRASWWRPW